MEGVLTIVNLLYEHYGNDVISFNRLLRQRVPPRGNRFKHDHPDTFLYIERSKNRNIVAYTANLLDTKTHKPVLSGIGQRCIINSADPVHAYFITLEKSTLEKEQKKGINNDIDELTYIQRKLAYGCSAKPLYEVLKKMGKEDIGIWLTCFEPYVLSYVALQEFPALLLALPPLPSAKTNDGHFNTDEVEEPDMMIVMVAIVNGVMSVLKYIYVCSVEPKHFYQLPSVKYIEIFGVAIDSGTETYEQKKR